MYLKDLKQDQAEIFLCCRLAGLRNEKGDRAWYMPGVQIIQIIPWHLRLRNLLFPRLVSEAQVYPGNHDCLA